MKKITILELIIKDLIRGTKAITSVEESNQKSFGDRSKWKPWPEQRQRSCHHHHHLLYPSSLPRGASLRSVCISLSPPEVTSFLPLCASIPKDVAGWCFSTVDRICLFFGEFNYDFRCNFGTGNENEADLTSGPTDGNNTPIRNGRSLSLSPLSKVSLSLLCAGNLLGFLCSMTGCSWISYELRRQRWDCGCSLIKNESMLLDKRNLFQLLC